MLDKRYDPQKVEEGKYESWKKRKYFEGGLDKRKKPFSLVIPPPNVTGKLHLGHAMDTIPMDIIARYKRLKGYDVLWVPGVDHAGIATQAKVEEKLREEGKNRYELGREAFLEETWKWKEEYTKNIHSQWAALGLSLDYSRERFTLDEGLAKAVKKVFITLYNEGLIYQGERIINWDPELKTALSNIEVVHQDDKGEFFYFYYDVVDSDEKLVVATTRPETMFGDVAVFVNPNDKRYQKYIGKEVINPANGEKLPIMADEYVDTSFGTGVMKCTPAHDPNDFNLAKKYNFPLRKIFDENARLTKECGRYAGLDRYEARKALVEQIKSDGHLQKNEEIVHSVGHSERSGSVVEPMLSKQWFVRMKPLAEKVLETQRSKNGIEFLPTRFAKVLEQWMENVDDWCVSRQLWWGHRIPAYYRKDTKEVLVAYENPDPNLYEQDPDVLDTWFSSALWPFATLNWPDTSSPDFCRYFPTSVLVTGYDIIFFWVSRMVFQSLHFTGQIPFKKVVIHGLIRDELGRKMSKSLGNGVDPLEVIRKYGADALRYFITTNSTPGLDMRYSEEKVQAAQNYLNKIWNSVRYVEMVLGEDYLPNDPSGAKLSTLDKGILDRLMTTIKKVTTRMDEYEFGQASSVLYDFVYDDFCSFYLEMSKVALQSEDEEVKKATRDTLYYVVKNIILMIYPYAPFVAEEMYLSLPSHLESIMLETYPEYRSEFKDEKSARASSVLMKMLKDIRNYKSREHLAPNAPIVVSIAPHSIFKGVEVFLERFAFAKKVIVSNAALKTPTFLYQEGYELQVQEEIDKNALLSRLRVEENKTQLEVERGEKMLNNPNFLAKAPGAKVRLEKDKLEANKKLLSEIRGRISSLENDE